MRLFHKKKPSETVQVLSEEEKRMRRCCFSGHRPEKLIRSEKEIKAALREEIKQAIQDGLTVFITGMARGVDYGK